MTTRRELEALRWRLDEAARGYCYRSGDPCLQWVAASADASALAEYRTRWPKGFPGTVERLCALVRAERAAESAGASGSGADPEHRGGRHAS
jgi:hypothetical protein